MANDSVPRVACLGWIVVHEACLALNSLMRRGFLSLADALCVKEVGRCGPFIFCVAL